MENTTNNILFESSTPGSGRENIVRLPRLRAIVNTPANHSFFEVQGIPQSSLDHYSNLDAAQFSLPYLYSLSWGHKVILFFCKLKII